MTFDTRPNENKHISGEEPFRAVTSVEIDQEEKNLPSDQSAASAQNTLEEAAREPSALGQGGFGAVDEHSGSYSYRIPVHVPKPQHGGPAPKISLVYNSQHGAAPSLVASGWRLELGRIVRSSETEVDFKNNQGKQDAADFFELNFNGSKRSLVIKKADQSDDTSRSFRIKIESSFLEVKYVLSKTQADPDSGELIIDYWEVFTANGTRYRYGHRESDQPGPDTGGELLNKVWNITEIEDVYGRKVVYEYQAISRQQEGELPYSYPTVVKSGVSRDGQWWDAEIRFIYSDADLPSSINGYDKLDSKYTGRSRTSCVIWQCLSRIETWFRDGNDEFSKSRELKVKARQLNKLIRWAEKVEEIAYKHGQQDSSVDVQTHQFSYKRTRINPALMQSAHSPMGKIELLSYDRATRMDKGTPQGFRTDMYLLQTYTEQAGDGPDAERWSKRYEYHNGYFFLPFQEYRGHKKVVVIDQDSGMKTESEFEQNGVHNGYTAKTTAYDAEGKKISVTETRWMALDYGGGCFLPFKQTSIEKKYAEDGETVLSTVINRIPKDNNTPWEYALDKHGNVLRNIQLTYAGIADGGSPVKRVVTNTRYKAFEPGQKHRLIGLPEEIEVSVETPDSGGPQLSKLEQRHYNTAGQAIDVKQYFNRSGGFYHTTSEYDADHGQLLRQYRFDGRRKTLQLERQYHGPSEAKRFLLQAETNALGHKTHYPEYDLQARLPAREVAADGIIEETVFDGLNRPVTEHRIGCQSTAAAGLMETITYQYTIKEKARSVLTRHENTGKTSCDYFDQLGRKTKTVESGYQSREVIHDKTVYDHKTRLPSQVEEPHYDKETSSPGVHITRYEEARLRKSEEILPSGKRLLYRYDGLTASSRELIYLPGSEVDNPDKIRLLQEQKDVLGRVLRRSDGRVDLEQNPPVDIYDYHVEYEYDALDRLVRVVDNLSGELQSFGYGNRLDDNPAVVTDPSSGPVSFTYDGLGRVLETRRGKPGRDGPVSRMEYDDLDRLTQQTDQDPSSELLRQLTNIYDGQPQAIGDLTEQQTVEKHLEGSESQHQRRIQYDGFGYPETEINSWSVNWPDLGVYRSIKWRTRLQHNGQKAGRLEGIQHDQMDGVSGGKVEYQYDDPSGLPIAVRFNGQLLWEIGEAGYSPRDQQQGISLGNGVSGVYELDPATGLPVHSITRQGDSALLEQQLSYDSSGNIHSRQVRAARLDSQGGQVNAPSNHRYQYDEKHQLTTAEKNNQQETYDYRPDGCRLATNASSSDKIAYEYESASPHRVTQLSGAMRREFTYDAQGRLLRDSNQNNRCQRKFSWLPSNRLHQLEFLDANGNSSRVLRYAYDGANQRSLKYDNLENRLFIYAGRELQLTLDDSSLLQMRSNILLPNSATESPQPEAPAANEAAKQQTGNKTQQEQGQEQQSGQAADSESLAAESLRRIAVVEQEPDNENPGIYYYHRDHQYSIVAVTDQDGELVSSIDYAPFGSISHQSGSYQPDVLYTGQRADYIEFAGFQHYDYKTRLYDPQLGIFLSPDPVDDINNAAYGHNRYAYVGNNPLNRIDPTGEWWHLVVRAAIAVGTWATATVTGKLVTQSVVAVGSGKLISSLTGTDYTSGDALTDVALTAPTGGLNWLTKPLRHSRKIKKARKTYEKGVKSTSEIIEKSRDTKKVKEAYEKEREITKKYHQTLGDDLNRKKDPFVTGAIGSLIGRGTDEEED